MSRLASSSYLVPEKSQVTEWTCPCLNIRLTVEQTPDEQPDNDAKDQAWLASLPSDNAITVQYPALTSRETITLEGSGTNAVCAKCLNCDTVVYAASKPAPLGPNRALGFNTVTTNTESGQDSPLGNTRSPSRDTGGRKERSRSSEPLVRPLDRKIWILPDALSPAEASRVTETEGFSSAFGVVVRRTEVQQRDANLAETGSHSQRSATPSRPSVSGTRQTSFSSTYALPPVPQHLITTPPPSPRVGGSATPPVASSASASTGSVFLGATSGLHPLALQLDSVAVDKLKDLRSRAEAEVFELVRQKRREMEVLEKRMKLEADALIDLARHPKPIKKAHATGNAAAMIGQALKGQQQRSAQSSPKTNRVRGASITGNVASSIRSQDPAASTPTPGSGFQKPSKPFSERVTGRTKADALFDLDSDLPPSAFERRPNYAGNASKAVSSGTTSTAPPAVPASFGGLSASFAMRGRELPAQLQDWAEKRRLRERYPQGDHSALPSAANSNVTSAANSSATSEDEFEQFDSRPGSDRQTRARKASYNTEDEAEMAQRGRARASSNARELDAAAERDARKAVVAATAPPTTTVESERRGRQEAVRGRTGRSVTQAYNPPAALSSSFLNKKPALAFVDDGRDADENTPSVGDRLVSSQTSFEPSAQVTLRPRDPPPPSAEPLKPATKVSTTGSDAGSRKGNETQANTPVSTGRGETLKQGKAFEKKVAFAETEDRVDHADIGYLPEDEETEDGEQPSATLDAGAPRKPAALLVDESADAVFEIDEDADAVGDEDASQDQDTDALDADEADQLKIEMSQIGLRTGESGRPRGQADDSLPGSDDEVEAEHPRGRAINTGSNTDNPDSISDDEDRVPPGFGAASFSALAASHTASHTLGSSMTFVAAEEAFDPASLRYDGRVVPAAAYQTRDPNLDSEPFVVGSLRNSSRRASVQLPSSIRSKNSAVGETAANTNSGGQPRSSSRSRIANMSKEDAETEVRLSGLLAPNAPSHRSLWSPQDAKTRKLSKNKFRLNEEDDEKWDAWKRKTSTAKLATDSDAKPVAVHEAGGIRSVPVAVAPPIQYISAASGIGPRPLRESTMIDPDYANSIAAVTSFDRNLAAAAETGRQIPKRTWGYGSFKDDTSGFETEPKTSLPYKEKMMVPSLRKALRKSMLEASDQLKNKIKLETIPDAEDASTSANAPSPAGQSAAKSASLGQSLKKASTGILPGSVTTKGFFAPVTSVTDATVKSDSLRPPVSGFTSASAASPASASEPAVLPDTAAIDGAQRDTAIASANTSGTISRTGTPNSHGRRSPRPPYVPPPPPTSSSTVLLEDPNQAPTALKLFAVPVDPCFQLTEEEEREEAEESEEDWDKVLKFMHVVEQLKINKRTGWMHHRVPRPESIADHQYRMAILSILCPPGSGLDLGKCVQLSVVHDLAEAEVGDLTPLDGVPKEEKMRREKEAIQYFVHDLLGSSRAGLRIEALWEEYEARETNESKLVKDLDRFELCLQAIEYERRYGINDLQPFFDGSAPYITHPTVRKWATVLARERSKLWNIPADSTTSS